MHEKHLNFEEKNNNCELTSRTGEDIEQKGLKNKQRERERECVCVFEREREREKEREKERERERKREWERKRERLFFWMLDHVMNVGEVSGENVLSILISI